VVLAAATSLLLLLHTMIARHDVLHPFCIRPAWYEEDAAYGHQWFQMWKVKTPT